MASVYRCEDPKHDRKVALKLLKPELAAMLGAERFVQEIKTTASLSHPQILPLFDSGTAVRVISRATGKRSATSLRWSKAATRQAWVMILEGAYKAACRG